MSAIYSVVQTINLSPVNQKMLEDWFQKEFGHIDIIWANPDLYVLGVIDKEIISCLRIIDRTIMVNEKPIRVAGIGGVITRFEWRKQGHATQMIEKTVEYFKSEPEIQFVLLLCRDEVVPVYQKNKFEVVNGPTQFKQPTGTIEYSRRTMVRSLQGQTFPIGRIDLAGLPW